VLEVLTPSIILIVFALLTVPVVNLIRKHNAHRSLLIAIWVIIPFLFTGVSILRLCLKYYGQIETQPFVRVFLVDGNEAHLSSSFLIDAVSMYMAVVYLVVGLISCNQI